MGSYLFWAEAILGAGNEFIVELVGEIKDLTPGIQWAPIALWQAGRIAFMDLAIVTHGGIGHVGEKIRIMVEGVALGQDDLAGGKEKLELVKIGISLAPRRMKLSSLNHHPVFGRELGGPRCILVVISGND